MVVGRALSAQGPADFLRGGVVLIQLWYLLMFGLGALCGYVCFRSM